MHEQRGAVKTFVAVQPLPAIGRRPSEIALLFWEEDEVNKRLEAKMCEAFEDVLKTSAKYKTDMRTAAYIVAINRVATVTKMRGMYA